MPNRILREGINSSRAVAALSDQAEVLYRRLISVVDDYGRSERDIDLIRAKCFPLQLEKWTTSKVAKAFAELCESPLVTAYHGAGRDLLQLNNFGQRVQSKPRYPAPEDCFPQSTVKHGEPPETTVNAVVDSKGLPFSTVIHGESRCFTAQSETESYSNTKSLSAVPAAATKGTRFSFGDQMPPEWLSFCREIGWEFQRAVRVYAKFGDYWRARPGKEGVKLDWLATWRNWCRKDEEQNPTRNSPMFDDPEKLDYRNQPWRPEPL